MKPLGWLLIFGIIAFIVTCFAFLHRSKKEAVPVGGLTKLFIAVLAMVIGILSGFILFIPLYLLVCVLCPNTPHNGHYAMPMAQVFFGSILAIASGLTATIIAYRMILRWRKV